MRQHLLPLLHFRIALATLGDVAHHADEPLGLRDLVAHAKVPSTFGESSTSLSKPRVRCSHAGTLAASLVPETVGQLAFVASWQ